MTRKRSLFVLGALAIAACSEAPVTPTASLVRAPGAMSSLSADDAGTYLVRFKGGIPSDFAQSVTAMGGELIFAHAGVGLAAVAGISADNAEVLNLRKDVAAVDADAYTVLDDAADMNVESVDALAATPASADNPAAAFFFPRQWNMRAVNAPAAWTAGKLGKASVRVGILDTGIDPTHPDLAGRVDMASSISLLSATENARVAANFPATPPTPLFVDLHYHGTHVAATVASNGIAAAGVTSKATLVAIKVCAPGNAANGFQGSCPTSAVLGGILYAADLGLDVINMSLGGSFARRDASARGGFGPSFIATINSVFNYAHKKGTTVVVAAGNAAMDMDHNGNTYVAYCNAPHVICVSSTGPTAQVTVNGPYTNIDALAFFSNYGRSAITVAAPGGNTSFVYAACSKFTIVTGVTVCRTGTFVLGVRGTSQAAPHVTGLAALIAGDVGHDPSQIAARITGSADDLGQPGTDPAYGKGRINVGRGATQ